MTDTWSRTLPTEPGKYNMRMLKQPERVYEVTIVHGRCGPFVMEDWSGMCAVLWALDRKAEWQER